MDHDRSVTSTADLPTDRPGPLPAAGVVTNRIGQVFVPVRDLRAAAAWYGWLLGVSPGDPSHEDTICDLPMAGDVRLALDANRPDFSTDGPPRFFFWCDDVHEAHRRLAAAEVVIEAGPVDIGSVTFLQFRDPDGNPLMACQPNG
jgi:catechol 2,3-dioxygenase-like lactoylglutathione lyase family enzyme